MEVGHGGRLYVLLPEHLHFHRCVGELVGEVVQEVWEVGRSSVDDSHHETRCLGLVIAERQGHKFIGEALHLCRRKAGQLLVVGVHHRRTSVGLLLDVNQTSELQASRARGRAAVQRGAVAEPLSDHGGDGGGGSRRNSSILVVLCGTVVETAAVAVHVNLIEQLRQTQGHP